MINKRYSILFFLFMLYIYSTHIVIISDAVNICIILVATINFYNSNIFNITIICRYLDTLPIKQSVAERANRSHDFHRMSRGASLHAGTVNRIFFNSVMIAPVKIYSDSSNLNSLFLSVCLSVFVSLSLSICLSLSLPLSLFVFISPFRLVQPILYNVATTHPKTFLGFHYVGHRKYFTLHRYADATHFWR